MYAPSGVHLDHRNQPGKTMTQLNNASTITNFINSGHVKNLTEREIESLKKRGINTDKGLLAYHCIKGTARVTLTTGASILVNRCDLVFESDSWDENNIIVATPCLPETRMLIAISAIIHVESSIESHR
jgi:hypothetical protein